MVKHVEKRNSLSTVLVGMNVKQMQDPAHVHMTLSLARVLERESALHNYTREVELHRLYVNQGIG